MTDVVVAPPLAGRVAPSGAPPRPRISVRGLDAFFGAHRAVRDVSIDFLDGQVTAIIGPSGCGKSTLLRCLNRMHETVPLASVKGEVLLDGRNLYGRGVNPIEVRRRIGMVFQRPTPFPTMSIRDNVAAGLRAIAAERPTRRRQDEIVEESLRRAGLWEEVRDRLRDSATALSGGQQQRLCIARALANRPEVLLLDEPCSALDPIATQKIEELLFQLKAELTIVIVTHNLQQAARVSDETAFFFLGRVVEFGPTERLFTSPSEKRTEDYITGRFG